MDVPGFGTQFRDSGAHCETVDERVVGLAVGPHQELSLGEAARDHVPTPG
jgi:hypothetical protein